MANTKLTTLRVPVDLLKRAERVALAQRRTRSSALIHAIELGLRRAEKQPPEAAEPTMIGGALD